MRAADRPTPPIALHDDAELLAWPMRPVVAIAGLRQVAEWDDPANVWDQDALAGSARVGLAIVGVAKVGHE